MTSYVFNSASVSAQRADMTVAAQLIRGLLETLSELDKHTRGEIRPFRLPKNAWLLEIGEVPGPPPTAITLGQVAASFYDSPETHDLAVYFDALLTYEPTDRELDAETVTAILKLTPDGVVEGYEDLLQPIRRAGLEAMQAAVTNSTLVSLDGPDWQFDIAKIRCSEQVITIDHAATPTHANTVGERWLTSARKEVSRTNFLASRQIAFPNLQWGLETAEQISRFPAEYLDLAFKRLAKLDDMVQRWRKTGSAQPDPGSMEIRNESGLTMDNYGNRRRFRSQTGEIKVFEQHVWIDRHNRIHLIVHESRKEVEIGYIGVHLPTWTN